MYEDTSSILCSGKLYAENFVDFCNRYDTVLYVHDFDIDGDLDILFYGRVCPGYENTNALLFFKVGKNYVPQELGYWIIKMKLSRKHTGMVVLKTPCCADFRLEYMYYESNENVRDSIRQFSHQIMYAYQLETAPAKTDTILTFSSEQKLIMSPNLTQEDIDLYQQIAANPEIGTLKPGVKLKAYNTYTENGKTWYYIIANANSEVSLNPEWSESYFGEIKAARGWVCLE